jgi:hypothetical protein
VTEPRRRLARLEAPLVYLIAAHSLAIGLALVLFPAWVGRFGGWGELDPLFFARQGGAFHLVVVIGYLGEWRLYRNVRLMVATKALAFVFLGALWLAGEEAWSVPFSAAADGLMGLAVAALHRLSAGAPRRSGSPPAVAPTSS